MTKFTPGPWMVGREGYNEGVVYSMYDGVCQVYGVPVNAWADNVGSEFTEGIANARLISSAPDMYEALYEARLQIKYLHDKFQETGTGNAVLAKIDAALSKAEGGA